MSALKLGIDISGFDLKRVGITLSVQGDDALPVSTSTPLHMSLIEFNALVQALKADGSAVEVSTRQSDPNDPIVPDSAPELRNEKWFDIVLEEEETRLADENSVTAGDTSEEDGEEEHVSGDTEDDSEGVDDNASELAVEKAGTDDDEYSGDGKLAADADSDGADVADVADVADAENGDKNVEDIDNYAGKNKNNVSVLAASSSMGKTTFGSDPKMVGDYAAVSKARDVKDSVDGENVGFFDGIRRSLGFNHDFESVPAETISRTSNAEHNAAVRDLVRRHIQDRNWE